MAQPGLLLSSSRACAGTELLLQAEASGRLKEQHTFLYAMAADLRVLDVDKLLSHYKVSTAISAALSVTWSRKKAHHCHITSWQAGCCTAVLPQTVLVSLTLYNPNFIAARFLRTACAC